MASDGDLNVGISSVDEVKKFVSEKRDAGVYLSVLGFGYGNYRDSIMEAVADNGNGAYYYIDCEVEAEKVFGTDLLSTLYTVAKDVKLQVTFDPGTVSEYRLIGYENRLMTQQDFEDDTKDAGELGAGHCVTVCYELKLNNEPEEGADHLFGLSVRYKKPDEDQSLLNEYSFLKSGTAAEADADTDLIAALCETAMILHGSEFCGDITLKDVLKLLEAHDYSADGYKQQFVSLISKLDEISEKETATEQ
jgi:Ca-activated chloride channel family protein